MDRRLCLSAVLLVGGVSIAAAAARQTPQPAGVPVPEVKKVRDNLYVIGGGDPRDQKAFTGGNTGIFITERGVVIVDTKLAGWGRMILDKVQSLTDKPVTTIINTHAHFDHAGSNIEFPASINFVAHENAKKYMMERPCPPIMTCMEGANEKYLPKQTFKDKLTLFSGKDQVDLYYFGPGHTNGDTFVVFPAVRAMHTGDMFQLKWLPFIDDRNGGSAVAYPETLAKAGATIKNVDTVITGHGAVMTFKDLQEHVEILRDFVQQARNGMKAGKSAADVASAYKLPAKYTGYTIDPERVKANFEMAYKQLAR